MKTMLTLVVVGIFLLVQASCAVLLPAPATPQSIPTRTPPIELQVLPRSARVGCTGHHELDPGGVSVWELPGVKPSDPDSAYRGDRGEWLGTLSCYTEVTVVNYAWSETDRDFWAYVRASDALEGWVPLNRLDLTP